jgi:hypothetical protein
MYLTSDIVQAVNGKGPAVGQVLVHVAAASTLQGQLIVWLLHEDRCLDTLPAVSKTACSVSSNAAAMATLCRVLAAMITNLFF